jgi:hypothetical protein
MRFSLKALLILVTVLGLFLGYSQRHRRAILSEAVYLRGQGIELVVPGAWSDWLWQSKPTEAYVRRRIRTQALAERLFRLGVRRVAVTWTVGEEKQYGQFEFLDLTRPIPYMPFNL